MNDLAALSPPLSEALAGLPPVLLQRPTAIAALAVAVLLVVVLTRSPLLCLASAVIAGALLAGLPPILEPDEALMLIGVLLGLLLTALSGPIHRSRLRQARRGHSTTWTEAETRYNETLTQTLIDDGRS